MVFHLFALQCNQLTKIALTDCFQVIHYRLPKHAVPKNYKLLLAPNMLENTFNGSVVISIRVLKPTKTITLHSNKLIIGFVNLRNYKNKNIPITGTYLSNDTKEFLHIELANDITEEEYELYIEFSGRLDKKIIGFYTSKFKMNRYVKILSYYFL